MQVERIAIAELRADPANARRHPERNIETIVASLHRFGQQKPIVVDKANIVRAGNGTLAAARSLGWTHLDAVRTELDGSNAIAYAIADNRTAELAEWDTEALTATLEGLQFDSDELLAAAGYSADELEDLLAVIVDNPSDEWIGMPEMENNAVTDVKLVVYFPSVEDKIRFSQSVKQTVNVETKFIWWPEGTQPTRQGVGKLVVENE